MRTHGTRLRRRFATPNRRRFCFRLPGGDALLFTGPKGATPKRGNWRVSVRWAERVKAAGLPRGFRFHDLRHTGNDLAARSGASTRELMHRIGHSTMAAALIYQHATDQRARQIADRLGEVVEREKVPAE